MGMFSIWHLLVLFVGFVFLAGGIALVVWLCVRAAGRSGPATGALSLQQRLQQLDELRAKGLLSEAEYQQQRGVIVSSIQRL